MSIFGHGIRFAAVAAAVTAGVEAAAGLAATPPVIYPEQARIGNYSLTEGDLRGAVRAFGPPSTLRSYRLNPLPLSNEPGAPRCVAHWKRVRLQLHFSGLCSGGPGLRCPTAQLTGSWRTSKGLRIGDELDKLYRLYPDARPRAGLKNVHTAWRELGGTKPLSYVSARFVDGRVTAFRASTLDPDC